MYFSRACWCISFFLHSCYHIHSLPELSQKDAIFWTRFTNLNISATSNVQIFNIPPITWKSRLCVGRDIGYRTRCPLCCFLDSHFVVSVTPFAVSVAHFVEMYSHFVDSVTHFVVSDQQSGNVHFQNVIRRPECWFSIWVESTIVVLQKPRINNSCPIKPNQQIV